MTAKQTADIAEAMEKLGYEIRSIDEQEETPGFVPKLIRITLAYANAGPKWEKIKTKN
jgi:hypothetical protein